MSALTLIQGDILLELREIPEETLQPQLEGDLHVDGLPGVAGPDITAGGACDRTAIGGTSASAKA